MPSTNNIRYDRPVIKLKNWRSCWLSGLKKQKEILEVLSILKELLLSWIETQKIASQAAEITENIVTN
jgi:hypothetical protein